MAHRGQDQSEETTGELEAAHVAGVHCFEIQMWYTCDAVTWTDRLFVTSDLIEVWIASLVRVGTRLGV
jgi:hypothetical protein